MTRIVPTEERPWGSYEVISSSKDGGSDVVVKRITVLPGKRLSLQSHKGREEKWTFVSGSGEVTVGEDVIAVDAGKEIVVSKEVKHRISNLAGTAPLVLTEVSTGVFDEDDIVRYEDDFGRAAESVS